uniref:Uncharacterized protein n=1 Tax=Micrurus corallinus TaxID=54390 RepID=A0A2D4GBU1_MICCO
MFLRLKRQKHALEFSIILDLQMSKTGLQKNALRQMFLSDCLKRVGFQLPEFPSQQAGWGILGVEVHPSPQESNVEKHCFKNGYRPRGAILSTPTPLKLPFCPNPEPMIRKRGQRSILHFDLSHYVPAQPSWFKYGHRLP